MTNKNIYRCLGDLDPELIAKAAPVEKTVENSIYSRVRWAILAACLVLVTAAVIIVPMFFEVGEEMGSDSEIGSTETPYITEGVNTDITYIPESDNAPDIPIENIKTPSFAPQYYGSESSAIISNGAAAEIVPDGISVTAKFIEALPDTYTFFDDWNQTEFRLIKMKTITLVTGSDMADEFYFIVPIGFMTDFLVYDTFVISHMGQFGYDFSVLYNATKQCAESIDTVIFGVSIESYSPLGTSFKAFDENGVIDLRLWNSTDAWQTVTKSWLNEYSYGFTKQDAETEAIEWGCGVVDRYVHTLDGFGGETKSVIESLKKFEMGVFAPNSSNKLWYGPDVDLTCRRYINGFSTNEIIVLNEDDSVTRSKALFSSEDLGALPNLPSAYLAVKEMFDGGNISPPHIRNHGEMKNTVNGIFGWYAKTENGVIGIVRVSWCYVSNEYDLCFDDAYYVIKQGSEECKVIDRDDMLALFGEYEKDYIYSGEYDELGKVYDHLGIPIA